jgi:hypothetical protein
MRQFCRPVLVFVLLVVATGCATTTPKPESQIAPDANLAAYTTFGWKPADAAVADEPLRILDVQIRTAIRAEMIARGYVEAEAEPQLLVTYESVAVDKVKSSPFRIGIGMGSFGSNVGGSVNVGSPAVQSYREGQLVIRILDAAANRELWFGSIAGNADRSKVDAESVARTVALAMQDFPARPSTP